MSPPNDNVSSFPSGISITINSALYTISPALINLLVVARQNYDWPAGTGSAISQARVNALEEAVSNNLINLNPANAHQIISLVSHWAGNNANSHANIVAAIPTQKEIMYKAINNLLESANASKGIDILSTLPGISLVIASKIYRFCCPTVGASVDRHSSYFFNSLQTTGHGFSTSFFREWSNGRHTAGRHTASRLAIYQNNVYLHNRNEYFRTYLPLLSCISDALNNGNHGFVCAATSVMKNWTPTNVEMAAYYWWACNGAR